MEKQFKEQPMLLVIDDQIEIAELLQTILEEENYKVLLCTKAQEALQEVTNQLPNLILLDMNMPHLNGWQILEKLRENPKSEQIPVILMTAGSKREADYRNQLEQYGAKLLVKPFNNNFVLELIKNLLSVAQ